MLYLYFVFVSCICVLHLYFVLVFSICIHLSVASPLDLASHLNRSVTDSLAADTPILLIWLTCPTVFLTILLFNSIQLNTLVQYYSVEYSFAFLTTVHTNPHLGCPLPPRVTFLDIICAGQGRASICLIISRPFLNFTICHVLKCDLLLLALPTSFNIIKPVKDRCRTTVLQMDCMGWMDWGEEQSTFKGC